MKLERFSIDPMKNEDDDTALVTHFYNEEEDAPIEEYTFESILELPLTEAQKWMLRHHWAFVIDIDKEIFDSWYKKHQPED